MNESIPSNPVAFVSGAWLPHESASIPVSDLGFIHGVTVAEQMRTFGGRIFLLDKHLERWWHGLEVIGIEIDYAHEELRQILQRLVEINQGMLSKPSEQGVVLLATPGDHPSMIWPIWSKAASEPASLPWKPSSQPRVLAHSYHLATARWRDYYRTGVPLVTVAAREVPAACWPKSIKVRSRANYYLAECQAKQLNSKALPLLLCEDGTVGDSSVASLVAFSKQTGLIVPPRHDRFHSVSVDFVKNLAGELGIPSISRALTPAELLACDEAFLVTTPWCLVPVSSLDGAPMPTPIPGNVALRLLQAWIAHVQYDFT